jgi:acetyl-CoA carboxylase carboxyl transferase subunit alpha
MTNYLEFERPLAEIEGKAEELRAMGRDNEDMDIEAEAKALDKKARALLDELYSKLTPWRKCQVARHPDRPHCKDYIQELFQEYTPLAGDRNFADDHSIMGGLARLGDRPVVVIGHEKGHDTKSRIARNFGMARPEGYRKAIRLMDLANRFGLPGHLLGRYPRRVSRKRGRRTRSIGSYCPFNGKMPAAESAFDLRHHRRRRVRWGGGLCHGQPFGDA